MDNGLDTRTTDDVKKPLIREDRPSSGQFCGDGNHLFEIVRTCETAGQRSYRRCSRCGFVEGVDTIKHGPVFFGKDK